LGANFAIVKSGFGQIDLALLQFVFIYGKYRSDLENEMIKPQLFLLHFAGGNAYSFQFLTPYLTEFELVPLELPGRGRRIYEDLLTDFNQAAQDMYAQIVAKLRPGKFMIYGHSMGAYLTLKVTAMLEAAGRNPEYIFVSGNAGPGLHSDRQDYLLEDAAFIDLLMDMGGLPEEILGNKELLEFVLPILRADFEIVEKNDLRIAAPVKAPLYAMMATGEEDVDKIDNWSNYTEGGFTHRIFEGGHFFIHQYPQQIATIIRQGFDAVTLRQFQRQ
jgi:external thioesterase TEII